jgi:hypothetical protein
MVVRLKHYSLGNKPAYVGWILALTEVVVFVRLNVLWTCSTSDWNELRSSGTAIASIHTPAVPCSLMLSHKTELRESYRSPKQRQSRGGIASPCPCPAELASLERNPPRFEANKPVFDRHTPDDQLHVPRLVRKYGADNG